MRHIAGMLVLAVLSGCGAQDPLDLNQERAEFAQHNMERALASMTSSCDKSLEVEMRQVQSLSYSPAIKFSSFNSDAVSETQLTNKATTAQRCDEIFNHLSGAPVNVESNSVPNAISVELKFSTDAEQEGKLIYGNTVGMRVDSAHLSFTDGGLNSTGREIEIRCPSTATVSCEIEEIGDYKKCDGYNVSYHDSCTFRVSMLPFSFSDHQRALLDVSGELKVVDNGYAKILINKISWDGLY